MAGTPPAHGATHQQRDASCLERTAGRWWNTPNWPQRQGCGSVWVWLCAKTGNVRAVSQSYKGGRQAWQCPDNRVMPAVGGKNESTAASITPASIYIMPWLGMDTKTSAGASQLPATKEKYNKDVINDKSVKGLFVRLMAPANHLRATCVSRMWIPETNQKFRVVVVGHGAPGLPMGITTRAHHGQTPPAQLFSPYEGVIPTQSERAVINSFMLGSWFAELEAGMRREYRNVGSGEKFQF
ncbi:hypothetical protein DFH07DRAFT_781958 [Mycena maculata]|uniref:Uncharacterized protein n=1 Tax=Mycena maculata TaxID=230809 RepID=A0AAD7HVN9_9AGAR|nr:hypothetical protein DFH07DRAFT_781958 [Mycena maculata]